MGEWIKKVWPIYKLFSLKNEWNPAIRDNMDEAGGYYTKRNRPDTEK